MIPVMCEHPIERGIYGFPNIAYVKDVKINGKEYMAYKVTCDECKARAVFYELKGS